MIPFPLPLPPVRFLDHRGEPRGNQFSNDRSIESKDRDPVEGEEIQSSGSLAYEGACYRVCGPADPPRTQ